MNAECAISILLLFGICGAVNIVVPPDSACACSGEDVQFNCTAEETVSGTTRASAQRWEIELSSGPSITVDSATPSDNPAGFEIMFDNDDDPIGLRVLSADLSLNQASLTCIGYSILDLTITVAAPTVTLEVAELSAFGFSCDVLCPQHYSSTDNQCTVEWIGPVATSCNTLAGYAVTINGTEVGAVDDTTSSHVTGVLEPFQSYTATVTAVSSCNSVQCSLDFVSPMEERPTDFRVNLLFNTLTSIVISTEYTMPNPLRVREFSVVVKDEIDQEILRQSFPGDSSSLSLDISSLQQCMNYTVSVTATNTGGSRTASAMLSLDLFTSLVVSCEVEEDGCYLEATCETDQPGLFSGCTLTYTSDGSSQSMESSSGGLTLRTPVLCDNQTISYEGQLLNQAVALGCVDSGTAKCPYIRDCDTIPSITNGTVTYSTTGTLTSGTVATYSCEDGYGLVGEETRTCLVNGTWTGAEPECQAPTPSPTSTSLPSSLPGWAIAIIIIIIVLLVIAMVVVMIVVLLWWRERLLRGLQRKSQDEVEMSENISYGPLPARKQPATSAGGGGTSVQDSTKIPEYEEIGPAVPPRLY